VLEAGAREREQLAARLRHLEWPQQALERHVPLIVLDRHGRVCRASAALCSLLVMDAASLLGRQLSALSALAPPREEMDAVLAALAERGSWSGTLGLQRADGTALPLPCAVEVLRNAEGKPSGYLGVATCPP
jgi:PAS domain S-box-containing protein